MSRVLKVMVALLAIAAFAAPAFAADDYKFSVYGSMRLATFYSDFDQADDSDFTMNMQGNSRFGMKASKGAVSGHYEQAIGGGLRLLYGDYAFDGGKLRIGQAYTAFDFLGQTVYGDDGDFIGYGAGYEGRLPQIAFLMDNGFNFYLVQNKGQGAANDTTIPKLEVRYNGKAGNFSYSAAAGYQTFDAGVDEIGVDAYLLGFMGTVDFNPAALTFQAVYGQNAKDFGVSGANYTYVASGEEDVDFMGLWAELSFKADDMNLIRVGVGYQEEDADFVEADNSMQYYIHDQYTIAPGFFVVPEITFIDEMDESDGSSGEESFHVGAKWQINF